MRPVTDRARYRTRSVLLSLRVRFISRSEMSTFPLAFLLALIGCVGCLRAAEPKASLAKPATAPAASVKLQPPGPADWASFRNGDHLLGVAHSELPEKLELLWTHEAGEMVASTAAIVGGHVYAASLKGEVFCLNLGDGQRLWTYRSIDDPDPKSFAPGFKSSPTVTADSIYLGDEEGTLHALDRATGKKRWTFSTSAEIVSSVSIYQDKLVFGSHDNCLYCLKSADGGQVWKFVTQGPVNCTPAIVGSSTFVTGCDEHLRVIDIGTGTEQTDIPLGTYLIASPAVVDNVLFVGTYASEVVAIDWKMKEKVWTYKDPQREFPYHASAAVTDDYVIAGSRDKRLHCIDRKTGKGVWVFETRGKVDSSAVVVKDRVFFGSTDGNLYGVTLKDGKEVFRHTDGRPFSASPAVGQGRLVIGSESNAGKIYCFGAK